MFCGMKNTYFAIGLGPSQMRSLEPPSSLLRLTLAIKR
jgi:hypothetical protein